MTKAAIVLIPVIAILVWLGWQGIDSTPEATPKARSAIVVPEAVAPTAITWQGAPPTQSVTAVEEVFKRAFWRLPSAEDEILQAERYEWRDADGVARWQWFIVVKASPGLLKDLRADNSFGLVPAISGSVPADAPSWFEFNPENVSEMRSADSELRLLFSNSDNTLYATASGHGFAKGAPASASPIQSGPASGRLPRTSPPIPKS